MKRTAFRWFTLATVLALTLTACGDRESVEVAGNGEVAEGGAMEAAMAAEGPDTTGAALWEYLQRVNYAENWQTWPGKGELYEGQEPHGMLLTTYLNDVAYEALVNKVGMMPAGAILVKENYMPTDPPTLAAVTTMYKVEGYNQDHHDWFWVKQDVNGVVEVEGRLAGCQNCHIAQQGNDYIFTGALR